MQVGESVVSEDPLERSRNVLFRPRALHDEVGLRGNRKVRMAVEHQPHECRAERRQPNTKNGLDRTSTRV